MTVTIGLPDVQGIWRRKSITAPGLFDDTTTVLWMQGPRLHVDMRVPADLNVPTSATALADLGSGACRDLARCEGFAGVTHVVDNVCEWTRHINYRGPTDGPDIGGLRWSDEGLVETGIHADYVEIWEHHEALPVQEIALSDGNGAKTYLLWSPSSFAFGRGRPDAMNRTHDLGTALGAGDDPASLFDAEFSFGSFDGDKATIAHSTNPLRIGAEPFSKRALVADLQSLEILELTFEGETKTVVWSRD